MSSPVKESSDLLEVLNRSKRIAFLTGAGVSTDSGIPDFKTMDREWPFSVPRATATSISFFNRDRRMFWEAFHYMFTSKTGGVLPNHFHRAVAGLEGKGKDVVVLTQNIDGLHQAAGTSQVLELHGNLRQVICNRPSCKYAEPLTLEHNEDSRCPQCNKLLRPDTVLFGEAPRGFGDAKQVAIEAELLIVAGTALEVGPVNDLPRLREWYFPERETVWVNRMNPPYGYVFSHKYTGELVDFSSLLEKVD